MLSRLRELKGKIVINKNSNTKKQIVNRTTNINLDGGVKITDPILPSGIINEAKEMAKKKK